MKDKLFANAFIFFVCSQYIFAKGLFANIFFYGMLMPVFIWHYRSCLKETLFKNSDLVSKSVLILFIYIVIHTIFIRPADWRCVGIIGSTISNYIFFISAREYFSNCEDKRFFFKTVLVAGCVGALLSILDYILNYNFPVRLKPWSSANHEITGASVYAILCLVAAYIFIEARSLKEKIFPVLSFCLCVIVILLSQSRGPMLALICSGLFLGIAYFRLTFVFLVSLKLLLICIIVVHGYDYLPVIVQELFQQVLRPDSYRLSIFDLALDGIKEKPWLGHGMRAGFAHQIARSPHNLFLGTAFYLGVPALIALLFICGASLYMAISSKLSFNIKCLVIAMVILGITASLTDNPRIIRSPSGSWIFFWMPLAFSARANLGVLKNLGFKSR